MHCVRGAVLLHCVRGRVALCEGGGLHCVRGAGCTV